MSGGSVRLSLTSAMERFLCTGTPALQAVLFWFLGVAGLILPSLCNTSTSSRTGQGTSLH